MLVSAGAEVGGVQLGLSLFKIYGQLNYGFNETYGAHVGLRLAK